MIEPLESRIAPAATVAYTDIDGDLVKITASAGPLDAADLTLQNGPGNPGVLQLLNLTDPLFSGASITFTVTQQPGGDGRAHVGYINATGVDLGSVVVKGDLAAIDAGDAANPASALKALTVQSLGLFGLTTQGGGGDLQSDFDGRVDKLTVAGDVKDAFVSVTDSVGANGKIGSVSVSGSLLGGRMDNSGTIIARDGIGTAVIKGSIVGGGGVTSGVLAATQSIGNVTVGGSIVGGDGSTSGVIFSALGSIGAVKVGGGVLGGTATFSGRIFGKTEITSITLAGSLVGGTDTDSGRIHSDGPIGSVKIGGSIQNGGFAAGGAGAPGKLDGGKLGTVTIRGSVSGVIDSAGDLGVLKIGGDLVGNSVAGPGRVEVSGHLGSITIAGSILGGGSLAGTVNGSTMGAVKIGRDVIGGTGEQSGAVIGSDIASVTVGGSVLGGSAFGIFGSGLIRAFGKLGAVKIGGDLRGGSGMLSGVITSTGGIASVTIGHSIIGTTSVSGQILCTGDLGPVKIGGDLRGNGAQSGIVDATGDIASVTIGGSVIGGIRGSTGVISADGILGPVKIAGDLRGGDLPSDENANQSQSGYIEGGRIVSVFVGGSVIAGFDQSGTGTFTRNASIRAVHDLGAVTIRGQFLGNESIGGITSPVISGRGQQTLAGNATTDLAIKSVTIGGSVELAKILGGFDPDDGDNAGSNGNASIGAVKIGGHWFASSISAGVNAGGLGFGAPADVIDNPTGAAADAIVARIASVTIKGAVAGAPNPLFQCGFVAQQIGSFKTGTYTAPLTAAKDPAIMLAPLTVNMNLVEV